MKTTLLCRISKAQCLRETAVWVRPRVDNWPSEYLATERRLTRFFIFLEVFSFFLRDECLEMNWSASAECFPRITKLLGLASYRRSVLLGLTVSVGGLTESLVTVMFVC